MHLATSSDLAKVGIANLRHERVVLDGSSLTCADVDRVARLAVPVRLSAEPARERVARARDMVAAAVAARETVYGVTTGFGWSATRPQPGAWCTAWSGLACPRSARSGTRDERLAALGLTKSPA